jgi:hypothetical protein
VKVEHWIGWARGVLKTRSREDQDLFSRIDIMTDEQLMHCLAKLIANSDLDIVLLSGENTIHLARR